jgi:predicted enzyme related to lactoylglutathione lyase
MLQKSPMYAYIPAKDLARARKFYEEKVGLRNGKETDGGVAYEFGEHTACFLYKTPHAGTSQASQAFWQVDDVEREVRELESRGVKFEDYDMEGMDRRTHVMTRGRDKAAWFKDSEGNIMAVIQAAK